MERILDRLGRFCSGRLMIVTDPWGASSQLCKLGVTNKIEDDIASVEQFE
jgi:hypothetical protein